MYLLYSFPENLFSNLYFDNKTSEKCLLPALNIYSVEGSCLSRLQSISKLLIFQELKYFINNVESLRSSFSASNKYLRVDFGVCVRVECANDL